MDVTTALGAPPYVISGATHADSLSISNELVRSPTDPELCLCQSNQTLGYTASVGALCIAAALTSGPG
ncbi:MAG: hypothetical protein WDA41_07390 [Candidatus Neomarinimicrobiota bacterium]